MSAQDEKMGEVREFIKSDFVRRDVFEAERQARQRAEVALEELYVASRRRVFGVEHGFVAAVDKAEAFIAQQENDQ